MAKRSKPNKAKRPGAHAELVKQKMAEARARGVKLGRPKSTKEESIRELLEAGWTQARVREELKAGYWLVRRVFDEMKRERER